MKHERGLATALRISLGIAASCVAAACLTPTDAGRFGEIRIRPGFEAAEEPATVDARVDSIRIRVRRAGSDQAPILDDTRAYVDGREHAWLVDLRTSSEDLIVDVELGGAGTSFYQGSRGATVDSRAIGTAPVTVVPMRYVGPTLAAEVAIVPARAAFSRIGAERQLTASARDVRGEPVAGRTFRWRSDDASVASVGEHGLVTSMGSGETTVVVTVDGVADSVSVIVDIELGRFATLLADPVSIRADAVSESRIIATIRDADGNALGTSAGPLALSSTLGTLGPAIDHGDGTYSATLTAATTVGTAVVSGTLDGSPIEDTASVEFVPGDGSPVTTTLVADPTSVRADGAASALVTVQLRDEYGNLVASGGAMLGLTTTLGELTPVVDHGDGTYTARITSVRTGTATIRGTMDEAPIEDRAMVEFTAGPGSPQATTLAADPNSVTADGVAASRVVVEVRDAQGNPVGRGGASVALATTLGTLGTVMDGGDGSYSAALSSTVAGTAVVSGTLDGSPIADPVEVIFTPGPGTPTTTTIAADPGSIPADGTSTSRIIVEVRDLHGNRVSRGGSVVALSATLGTLGPVTDHGDGSYSTTLTASVLAETATVGGTLDGSQIAHAASVAFTALPPQPRMLSTDRTTYAPGTMALLTLANRTDGPIGYNLCQVVLERWTGAVWHSVPSGTIEICTDELLILEAGDSVPHQHRIPTVVEAGEYRYRTSIERVESGVRGDETTNPFRIGPPPPDATARARVGGRPTR